MHNILPVQTQHTYTLARTYTYADACFYTEINLKFTNIISVIHGANVERGKTFTVYLIYL